MIDSAGCQRIQVRRLENLVYCQIIIRAAVNSIGNFGARYFTRFPYALFLLQKTLYVIGVDSHRRSKNRFADCPVDGQNTSGYRMGYFQPTAQLIDVDVPPLFEHPLEPFEIE